MLHLQNGFNILQWKLTQDSVRNDNTEKDLYTNRNAKLNFDVQDFTITMDYTDYSYDYDNCYDSVFNQSNDCEQDGEKYNIALNNEYFTLGRTHDKADYYTGEWMSMLMKVAQTIQELVTQPTYLTNCKLHMV